jgi:N-acetyl-anhydromuramyl-L-alanine amidase AmpD
MSNYPNAHAEPGPAFKQNGGKNKCRGVVCHSMVGSYAAARGELMNPNRRASWHYSVLKDGSVISHYPDEAQTWHCGSVRNNDLIGIEHEGGLNPHNEPLTRRQADASVNLVRWLGQTHHFPLVRHVSLWEHNEVSDAPTACPSGRIPWVQYSEEEDDMAITMAACGDAPGPATYRVYALGSDAPKWIVGQLEANQLIATFGQPKPLSWKSLQALGAT